MDRIFLQVYDPDLGAMRTIATASYDQAQALDLLTPMPQKTRDLVRKNLKRYLDGAVIVESPEKNPMAPANSTFFIWRSP